MNEEQIREELKNVIDPELGINIVDLGLVYDIKNNDGDVRITMTLTTPGCPMHSSMEADILYTLHEHNNIHHVDVELVWEPRWTPEVMSEEAKEMLWGSRR